MPPDDVTGLFIGIAGASLDGGELSLGHGVSLAPSYAHLMRHPIAAFRRPPTPKDHHPTPWHNVAPSHLDAVDIEVELSIPANLYTRIDTEPLTCAWVIVASLRVRSGHPLRALLLSDQSFAEVRQGAQPRLRTLEHPPWGAYADRGDVLSAAILEADDVNWVARWWEPLLRLYASDRSFALAFTSMDEAALLHDPGVALVTLWGGIEQWLVPEDRQISHRLATRIAMYLAPEDDVGAVYHLAKDLYRARSAAAHGERPDAAPGALRDSLVLARRLFTRVVETGTPPELLDVPREEFT